MAYTNEKRLDTEARHLQANAAQFAKQSMQWLSLIENFNTALKVNIQLAQQGGLNPNAYYPCISYMYMMIYPFDVQLVSVY